LHYLFYAGYLGLIIGAGEQQTRAVEANIWSLSDLSGEIADREMMRKPIP